MSCSPRSARPEAALFFHTRLVDRMASDPAGYASHHSAAAHILLEAPVVAGTTLEPGVTEHTDPAVDASAKDTAVVAVELAHIGHKRAL